MTNRLSITPRGAVSLALPRHVRACAGAAALGSLIALAASACIVSESADSAGRSADTATVAAASAFVADSIVSVPAEDSASMDTVGLGSQMDSLPPLDADSEFKRIAPNSTDATPGKFPVRLSTRGPVVLQIQILLDRAHFSPGIVDGTWGPNAAKALQWFRIANGMDSLSASDSMSRRRKSATLVDKPTYDKLIELAQGGPLIDSYELTADDIDGPYGQIPDLVYDQAKLKCLCYTSAAEELAEKFHTTEQVLKQLNPGVDFKSVSAGTSLQVPKVGEQAQLISSAVARIAISSKGYWLHALDASGQIVAHFPSTLGAGYDPSPTGAFRVTGIAHDPAFNYQPALMAEVPDTRPTAKLPPGPNSPVGVVWMALSKPHYGIHGTSSPQTIGYANSHGCVRLTNWDAEKLASLVSPGTPVEFQ